MTIDLGNGKSVISMTLIDMESGHERVLFEREGSRCLFSEDFSFGNYMITLRVDWGDIQNTDPVLDADIFESQSDIRGRRLRNGPWHHTQKEFNEQEGRKVYCFTFKELNLRLGTKISFGLSVRSDAILV